MKITFESDSAKLQAHLDEIVAKITPAAQVSALNSVAGNVRSKAIGIAQRATGVPREILSRRIAVPKRARATLRKPDVIIFGGIWAVKVSKLKPAPRRLKKGGVKYKTLPGESMNPEAFMGKNTKGSDSVFVRKGAARLPIKNVTVDIGPAVKSAIGGYSASLEAKAYYEKILFSQMDRRVRGSLRRLGMNVK